MRRKQELLTISEAAERVQTTRERLYKAIKRGDLKAAMQKRRHTLLSPEEVDRWAALPILKGGRPKGSKNKKEESNGDEST